MKLTKSQRLALQNLSDKGAGQDVGWINISDAQELTELGLARRTRAGWEITLDGGHLVEKQGRITPPAPSAPIPFLRPHLA